MQLFLKAFFACFLLLTISYTNASGQTPAWAFGIGSTGADVSRVCKVAPNGNVCIAGKFAYTMDIDPGSTTRTLTSAGQDDIFLACYSPAGNLLWGFGLGGAAYDAALNMVIDDSSNVTICGYIQTAAIDFDPGAGVTYVGYAGGTGLSYNGDGFVASYTSSGAFRWAKDIGGSTVNDATVSLSADPNGNIYAGGIFNGTISVSASGSLNSAVGKAYIIKYDSTGTLQWAHNYGNYSNDCIPNALLVSNGYLFAAGYFGGTADFNPWGTAATYTASGNSDPYLAKYDTAGNFVFVKPLSGAGSNDQATALSADTAGNIYLGGFTNSASVTFNTASAGSTTVSAPGGGGNYDLFMARYSSGGAYQWGKVLGGPGDEFLYATDVAAGNFYITGGFHSTVDFDPSASTASLTSAGGADIFVAKYALDSRYICSYKQGSAGIDDIGFGLAHADSGAVLVTGQFGGSAVDFDPSYYTLPLSSNGNTDAFTARYKWLADTTFAGYLTGDTICVGQPAYLTLHITAGAAGPYTLSITDGSATTT
ncbi:MAG: hypothetical protein H7257_03280, partial [Taibaiella sp.]|nr:hypothetical protein [Taibaiella sp.]